MIKPITKFPTWVYIKIKGGVYKERPAFTLFRIVQLEDTKFGKKYIYNATIKAGRHSKKIIEKEKSQFSCKYIEGYFSLLSRMGAKTKKNLFDNLFNL